MSNVAERSCKINTGKKSITEFSNMEIVSDLHSHFKGIMGFILNTFTYLIKNSKQGALPGWLSGPNCNFLDCTLSIVLGTR